MARSGFKMRSGNSSSFKMMGSSPTKRTDIFEGDERIEGSVVSTDKDGNKLNSNQIKEIITSNPDKKYQYPENKGFDETSTDEAFNTARVKDYLNKKRKMDAIEKAVASDKTKSYIDNEGNVKNTDQDKFNKRVQASFNSDDNSKDITFTGGDDKKLTELKAASEKRRKNEEREAKLSEFKKNNPVTKKSPYTKSYKEAYKNADKKKYKTEAEFVKAAKAYNTKKYGTTEPTKEAKKMKNTYKDVTDVKSGKKKLTQTKSYSDKKEVENKASTKSFRAKQAENTANKKASDAKGPKTKKRTKAGKISTKVANIFRGKGKKKDPNRKEV